MARMLISRAVLALGATPAAASRQASPIPTCCWSQRRNLASGGSGNGGSSRDQSPARNEHSMPEGGSPDDLAHSKAAFDASKTEPQQEAREIDAEKGTKLRSRSVASDAPTSMATHKKGDSASRPNEKGEGNEPPTSGFGNQKRQ